MVAIRLSSKSKVSFRRSYSVVSLFGTTVRVVTSVSQSVSLSVCLKRESRRITTCSRVVTALQVLTRTHNALFCASSASSAALAFAFNPESNRRASTVSFTKLLPFELALVDEAELAPSRRSSVRSQSRARAEKSSTVRFHRALSVVVVVVVVVVMTPRVRYDPSSSVTFRPKAPTAGRMDGWMDGSMDGWMNRVCARFQRRRKRLLVCGSDHHTRHSTTTEDRSIDRSTESAAVELRVSRARFSF